MSDVGIDIVLRSQMAGALAAENALDRVEKSADGATSAVETLGKQIDRTAKTANTSSRSVVTAFEQMENRARNAERRLRELALQGKTNTDRFRSLKAQTDAYNNALQRAENSIRKTNDASVMLSRGLSLVMAALSVKVLGQYADAWSDINSRVRIAAGGIEQGEAVMARLDTMARRTYSSMSQTAETYLLNATAMRELGYSTQDTLDWVESINNALVVSGAKGQRAESVMNALSKAMADGKLSGDNLNTVIQTGGRVSEALASSLGVGVNELRRLGSEGKITSAHIVGITSQLEKLREEADSMPATLGDAWVLAGNAMMREIGRIDQANEVTKGFAENLIGVADNMDKVGQVTNAVVGVIQFAMTGLSKGFSGLTATIGMVGVSVLKVIETIVNGISSSINWIAEKSNSWLGTDFQKFGKIDITSGLDWSSIGSTAADQYSEAFSGKMPNLFGAELEKSISADLSKRQKAPTQLSAEALKALEKRHKALEDAIKSSRTEEERLLDTIRELENMRGIARTAKEAQGLEVAIRRTNTELEELRIKAERNGAVAKAFESLANQIDDGFRDAFRTAFTESDGGWKALLDGWKNTFKTFLADLAYMALARPIVISMVGAVGGIMGVSSGAQASILGDIAGVGSTGGSGFGIGNLSSIGNGLLNGGLYSNTLGGIGTGIGNMLSGYGYGFTGPTQAGAIGGGALGNMGYGAIGSLAANLFGLGGGIGGMAGGAIGSLAGGAIGTSMGTILGFAGGPIGALAGGFLGSALGGLFGGKKPSDKAQWGSLDLSNLETFGVGGFTGKKFSQQNSDYRDAVLGEASNLAQLLQSVGGTTSGSLKVYVGSRDGLWLGDRKTGESFGNNSEAFVQAVLKRVVDQTTGLSDTFKTILDKVGVSDTQKLAESFEFGKYYESVINPVDAVAEAIKAVNAQFDALAKQAQDLGLTSAIFTEKLGEQRQAQLDLIKAQQAGFQSLEAMKSTFDSWLYDQSMGSTSTLSPTEKLIAAQGNFGGLLDAIRGGDVSKTQELLQAGQQLLQIGQSMYASSTSFAGLEEFVRNSIGSVAKQLGVPGYASGTRSARSGMAWVGERGPELVRFNGGERVYNAEESKMMVRQQAGNDARFASMGEDMAAMRDDIKNMTRQLSRVATQMIVTGTK